jgi:hypothetical protein
MFLILQFKMTWVYSVIMVLACVIIFVKYLKRFILQLDLGS